MKLAHMDMAPGMEISNGTEPQMGSMGMSVGYFNTWDTFQMTLLFSPYGITERWQFALTWFAVVLTVICYYALTHVQASLDQSMITVLKGATEVDSVEPNVGAKMVPDFSHPYSFAGRQVVIAVRPLGWQSVKIVHSVLAGVKYALSLMLMLVAMTFNPSLFLALFVGSVIGEYVCCDFHIDLTMGVYKPLTQYGGIAGKIIHFILCVKKEEDAEDIVRLVETRRESKKTFAAESAKMAMWFLPRLISMIIVIIVLVWVMEVEGTFGFVFTSVFGWHALCMTLFVVVFMNEAVLGYMIPLFPQLANDRKSLRRFHTLCHILSLASVILGMVAIYDFKLWGGTTSHYDVAYSGHSWMGILTMAFWVLQFCAGIYIYAIVTWPPGSQSRKDFCVEVHHFFGYCVYALGLATCATGLQDMQSSDAASLAASLPAMMAEAAQTMMTPQANMTTDDGGAGNIYFPPPEGTILSSVGCILLVALGMSTFGALKFYPKGKDFAQSMAVMN